MLGAAATLALASGAAFASVADYSIESADVAVAETQTDSATAICPQGTSMTGGGFGTDRLYGYRVDGFSPNGKRNFEGTFTNTDSSTPITFTAYAVCDDTGKYTRETGSKPFENGQTKAMSARCPRGTHVSGGGVGGLSPDFKLLATRPGGSRAWKAKATYVGAGTSSFTVIALCDHSKGGEYTLKTATAQGPPARPAARGLSSINVVPVKASCPRGTRATGGGWGIDTLDEHRSGISLPGKRSWSARFLAGDGDPTHFKAYVLCKDG